MYKRQIQVWEQEEADEIVLAAHKAGFQVTAHAVGDKAVTIMVNAIEKALRQYPREDHRHRIEHRGLTNPELIGRIATVSYTHLDVYKRQTYDKAVEVVADTVLQETQKEDLRLVEKTKKMDTLAEAKSAEKRA